MGHFVRWCDETGIENLNTLTGRDIQEFRIWRQSEADINSLTLRSNMDTITTVAPRRRRWSSDGPIWTMSERKSALDERAGSDLVGDDSKSLHHRTGVVIGGAEDQPRQGGSDKATSKLSEL
jgi:hypothetical protein